MSNKQKIRYAVLGSVITFVGMMIVAMGVSPLIAQKNGVFDEVQCTKLTVVDKAGKPAIVLNAIDEANHIMLFDKKGKPGVHLWVSEGQHSIAVLDEVGQTAVSLRALENGNGISIHDKAGKVALNLFVTQTPMGNGIVVYDQAGNIKWAIPISPPTGGEQ